MVLRAVCTNRTARLLSHLCFMGSALTILAGCATPFSTVSSVPGGAAEGEGTVVASFLINPTPEWSNPPDHFWINVWSKSGFPCKEYSITFPAGEPTAIVKHLPAGRYAIHSVFAGKPGFLSRGHAAQAPVGIWFRVPQQKVAYIGDLELTVRRESARSRARRQAASDKLSTAVAGTLGGVPTYVREKPKLYIESRVENTPSNAVKILKEQGWSDSDIAGMTTSLMSKDKPDNE